MGDIQFVASLSCQNCGETADADTRTELVSNVLTGAGYVIAKVGDTLDIGLGELQITFLELRKPVEGEKIHILEKWICPSCGSTQWAKIVLDEWIIEEIKAVAINEEVLSETHYLSDLIQEWLMDHFGEMLTYPYASGEALHQELMKIMGVPK